MACSVSWLQTVRTPGTVRLVYLWPIADRDLTAQDPVEPVLLWCGPAAVVPPACRSQQSLG